MTSRKQNQKKTRLLGFYVMALLCAGAIITPASYAYANNTKEDILKISQPGDGMKNCADLSQEISLMDNIMEEAEEQKRSTKTTGTGVGVAQTVGSFMIGSLGGVLGIFAAGAILDNAADGKIERLQDIQNAASQRRSLMAALYDVKSCQGPLAQKFAGIEPAAGEEFSDTSLSLQAVSNKPDYND